ncbi:MAG: T9SS type A sorting domain-containing protein [Bacteroidetes bacterium]|nr:T9SS type A sorting domain-containing protein [Bacteroidota bacterium]
MHVWLAANDHSSYNRYDLVYHVHVNSIFGNDEHYDNVDYGSTCPLYFQYDYLEKMGEVYKEYGAEIHDMTFFYHNTPKGWDSKQWLAYTGWLGGEYWVVNVGLDIKATPPPISPGQSIFYYNFFVDYDEFGHVESVEQQFLSSILFWQIAFFDWAPDPTGGDYTQGSGKYIRIDSYSPGSVTITWESSPPGELSQCKIYRLLTASYPNIQDFEYIALVSGADTIFTDDSITVPDCESYLKLIYYVTFVDNSGIESEPSNMIMPKLPASPQNILADAPEPDLHPVISWSPNEEYNILGYNIYKKLILPDSTIIPFTLQNAEIVSDTIWIDTTFIAFHGGAETAYYYVTAVNEDNGESAPSEEVSGEGRTPFNASESSKETIAFLSSFTDLMITPNPFNNKTNIKFIASSNGIVNISIYNLLGQKIADIYNAIAISNHEYSIEFDAGNLVSGIYICKLNSSEHIIFKKLLLLK